MTITPRLRLFIATVAGAVALAATPAAAQTPLFPAGVSQANLDCLFGVNCTVAPDDVTNDIPLPGITGKAVVHTRVLLGVDRSRADGRTLFQYRVDLTEAVTQVDASCIINLTVKFGPVAKLPYAPGPVLRDVYQISQGVPAAQIGFVSAIQTGDFVTFTFERPVCASSGNGPGDTSRAFGLASVDPPLRATQVLLDANAIEDLRVKSFVPRR